MDEAAPRLREIRGAIVVESFGQREAISVLVDANAEPTARAAVALLRRLVDVGRGRADRGIVEVSVELLEETIVAPLERIFPPE